MLKHSLYAVAATAALIATSAHAQQQSNVQIYGRVNLSIENQKFTGSRVNAMQDNASRFGLIGNEIISPGLSAIYNLEAGFNADTGTARVPGSMFNRESWVGLSSNQYGTLRMGNTTSPTYFVAADYVSMHNHDTGTSSDALFGFDATGGNLHNVTAYKTPTFYNGSLELAYALAERDGNMATVNAAYYYDNGPLHLGAGYAQSTERGTDDSKARMATIRALYEFGAFTLGGYYEYDKYDGAGRRNNFRLAGMYTLGAQEFHLNAGYTPGFSNIAKDKAYQFTVAYNYNLSKRTKIYAFYTKLNNDENAIYAGAPGEDFASFAVGLRHNF